MKRNKVQPADADRSSKARPWRRHLRATREGRAFLIVTLLVGIAAFNTGNNLMFLILGFMLSLIVLSGILSELVLRQIEVSRRLPRQPHAGHTSLVEIALRNNKRKVPSYSLEVEDQVLQQATERRCYFLKVAPQSEQVAAYRRTPARRGYLRFSSFRVATRYPFGIFEKWRVVPCKQELLVYPALLGTHARAPLPQDQGADTAIDRVGTGVDLIGLRGYQEGDEARMIHWRRTASMGRIVVVERQTDSSTHLTILLDNAQPEDADPAWAERFEYAISTAATLALDSLGRGFAVEVLSRGARSPVAMAGGDPEPVLRFLALLSAVPIGEAAAFPPHVRHAGTVEVPIPMSLEGSSETRKGEVGGGR